MSKTHKIDKEFLITDSSVNGYGFRLLTSGYEHQLFMRNPVGYYMHNRDGGVLLKWEDLRVDGDKVFAKPVINMSHPRAVQTVAEIENGFLNAASVGFIIVLAASDDEALKLPGQTGPTVTRWYNRECSIVDLPGNENALQNLCDAQGNEIQLSAFTSADILNKKIEKNVSEIKLTAAQLAQINLKADATPEAVVSAFVSLKSEADKVPGLQADLQAEKKKLADYKTEQEGQAISTALKAALDGGKITKKLHDQLAVDYAGKKTELENLLASMPEPVVITNSLKTGVGGTQKELAAKWDELDKDGSLENLKATAPEEYREIFKAKFGVEPRA